MIIFFIPFLVISVLTGAWALQITVRMIGPYFSDYNLMVLSTITLRTLITASNKLLISVSIIFGSGKILCSTIGVDFLQATTRYRSRCHCGSHTHHGLFDHKSSCREQWVHAFPFAIHVQTLTYLNCFLSTAIIQLIILFEMVLLSFFAHRIYRLPSKRRPI